MLHFVTFALLVAAVFAQPITKTVEHKVEEGRPTIISEADAKRYISGYLSEARAPANFYESAETPRVLVANQNNLRNIGSLTAAAPYLPAINSAPAVYTNEYEINYAGVAPKLNSYTYETKPAVTSSQIYSSPDVTSSRYYSPATFSNADQPAVEVSYAAAPAKAINYGTERAAVINYERAPVTSYVSERAPITNYVSERAPVTSYVAERAPVTSYVTEHAPVTNYVNERAPIVTYTAARAPVSTQYVAPQYTRSYVSSAPLTTSYTGPSRISSADVQVADDYKK